MAQYHTTKDPIAPLEFEGRTYDFIEQVDYPNGGFTCFYEHQNMALAVDFDICRCDKKEDAFPYSLITDKQNQYMKEYLKFYRVMVQDLQRGQDQGHKDQWNVKKNPYDRGDTADASALEFLFEEKFSNVYGMSGLEYLVKEHCISDEDGNQYFLDYFVNTKNGQIAVEENGVTYHHPQIIGEDRYRKQLNKQNACTRAGSPPAATYFSIASCSCWVNSSRHRPFSIIYFATGIPT